MEIRTGIVPITSITANNVNVTVTKSFNLKSMLSVSTKVLLSGLFWPVLLLFGHRIVKDGMMETVAVPIQFNDTTIA
jgi:hypothetical protein